jgi:hypothetical protein
VLVAVGIDVASELVADCDASDEARSSCAQPAAIESTTPDKLMYFKRFIASRPWEVEAHSIKRIVGQAPAA